MLNMDFSFKGMQGAISNLVRWRTRTVPEVLRGGTEESLRQLMLEMQQYPPESEANRPPHPYWARGVGRIHAGGTIDPQSEQYDQSWDLKITQGNNEVFGELTNAASYAPWIGRRATQAWFHAARGWPTIEDKAESLGLTIGEINTRSKIGQRMRSAVEWLRERLRRG